jgi:hypothetical protein
MCPNFRDGSLEQGQAFPLLSKTVLLTADNTAVTPESFQLIFIGSDNTTATNRTFTLAASTVGAGHQLTLQFNTGGSTTCELADSGTMKLLTAWTPVQYDTLTLLFDGTNWNEVARGTSTGATARTLTSAHIWVGNGSNVETDTAVTGDVTISNSGVTAIGASKVVTTMINADAVTNAKLADACVSIEQLDSGIAPAYFVYAAGTVAMSGTSQDITVASATTSDIAFVQINTADSNSRTVLTAITAADKVTVTYSGAAGTGGNISYQVLRVAS